MLSGSGKPFMKLINLRKLADLYLADFNLLKDKWKIALFSKQVHGYFDAQLKKKVLVTKLLRDNWHLMLCKVSKVRFDGFLCRLLMQQEFSRLAFALSLTDSKCIVSSSHLDYCSRIAGNTSNQDVSITNCAVSRKPLNRCTNLHELKGNGRWSNSKTPMKNKQNETHGYNRTHHCGTKA